MDSAFKAMHRLKSGLALKGSLAGDQLTVPSRLYEGLIRQQDTANTTRKQEKDCPSAQLPCFGYLPLLVSQALL